MTIAELKEMLNAFDDDKCVFVFDEEHHEVKDVESVSDNNGHLQLNAE